MSGDLIIRPLASLEEYQACADFQEEIWGRGFSEKVSAAILMIANRLGGIAAGAFDEAGRLQGFVFGLTGVLDGRLIHWSDMLAVRDDGRDRGIGTRLKRYQRDLLLSRGIREMRWTFDPLQGRNAHVNFSKLGVICREYSENLYGETDSPLHRGIGTDRLVALWLMDSLRVLSRLGGERPPAVDLAAAARTLPVERTGGFPVPGAPRLGLRDPQILIPVPAVVEEVMRRDLSLAVQWRETTRAVFVHYFSRGYEAREFFRGEEVSYYLLRGSGSAADPAPGESPG
jgi:predicted GNAT superfamily acetyltransferase